MAHEDGYNGWSNYETWCVNLWLENDEGSYSYWREVAQGLRDEHMAEPEFENEDGEPREPTAEEKTEAAEAMADGKNEAITALAERLESETSDAAPDVTGLFSDLLTRALGRVDWREIAVHMIEEE